MYEDILGRLQALSEKLLRSTGADAVGVKVPITKDDVGYLLEEVFRGKSVISGLPTRLALVPWNKPEAGWQADTTYEGQKLLKWELGDLVCMTKEEAVVHEREVLRGSKRAEDVYGRDIVGVVERRRGEERGLRGYR